MFKCDCCGLCCMYVSNSHLYRDLDRGDGICRFFNCNTKLCNIYSDRPDKCNVDKMYQLYFKKIMTEEEYYQLNYSACEKFKSIESVDEEKIMK